MAVFALAGAKACETSVSSPRRSPRPNKAIVVKNVRAESDRSYGYGAVGQAADHHGVHDGHAHPASSARTRGTARRIVGRSSSRR